MILHGKAHNLCTELDEVGSGEDTIQGDTKRRILLLFLGARQYKVGNTDVRLVRTSRS
jgi:hypothetical protein